MNNAYLFPPLVNQLREIKRLKLRGKIIDLRSFKALSLEDLYQELFKKIKRSIKQHKNLIFLYFDLLLPLGSMPLLNLESLQSQKPKISFCFCIGKNIFSERLFLRLKKSPLLFENINYVPLKKAPVNARLFLENLGGAQRRILCLALRGQTVFQKSLQQELDFLLNLNIIKRKKGRFIINFPSLSKTALEIPELVNVNLSLKNQKILAEKTNITPQLSPVQQDILKTLLKNKGKVVSRETIAQSIWKKGWENKYSDWAIDQAVSGLRRKLEKLWINPQLIKTIKKKGFSILKASNLHWQYHA